MRLGWDHSVINAPELAARAEAVGAAAVTVHGRTRCQFYGGQADWSAVRAVKDAVSIPVIVMATSSMRRAPRRLSSNRAPMRS